VRPDDGKSPIRVHNPLVSVHDEVVDERQEASFGNYFSSLLGYGARLFAFTGVLR